MLAHLPLISRDGQVGHEKQGFPLTNDLEDIQLLPLRGTRQRIEPRLAQLYANGIGLDVPDDLANLVDALL